MGLHGLRKFATLVGCIAGLSSDVAGAAIRFEAPFLKPPFSSVLGRVTVANVDPGVVPDILSPWYGSSLALLIGTGNGQVSQSTTLAATDQATTSWADFDADGFMDIAFGGVNGSGVLFGNGTGTAWTAIGLDGHEVLETVSGDFDADGSLDVAMISSQVDVFLSRPGRTFERITSLRDTLRFRWPSEIVREAQVADLSGDGLADLVVSGDHGFYALVGRGDGGFVVASVGPDTRGFELADMNGDGTLDALVGRWGHLGLCLGNGDGTFGPEVVLDSRPEEYVSDVVVGDVGPDGTPDVVFATGYGRLVSREVVNGEPLGAAVEWSVGRELSNMVLVDMNLDERVDVVATSAQGGCGILLADADGLFGAVTEVSNLLGWLGPVHGDFNEDGIQDLIAGDDEGFQIFLGNANRTFAVQPMVTTPSGLRLIGCADLDEDGHLDVLALVGGQSVAVYLGIGDGGVHPPTHWPVGPQGAHDWVTVDVNGDGHRDVVLGMGSTITTLLGDGSGALSTPIQSPMSGPALWIRHADLTGDGIEDVAIGGLLNGPPFSLSDGVTLATGNGNGGFSIGPPLVGGSVLGLATADMNHDARPDLVAWISSRTGCVGPMCGAIAVFLQDAGGGLSAPSFTDMPSSWTGGGWGLCADDLDDDLIVDLVVGGSLQVFKGNGAGLFDIEGGYVGSSLPQRAALADFDGDGYLDAAVTGGSSTLHVYYGRDPVSAALDVLSPSAGTVLVIGTVESIAWSAADNVGVDHVDIFLSRHGAVGPFERLAIGLSNSGSWPWTVAGSPTDSAVFKLVARDMAGNVTVRTTAGLMSITENVGVGSTMAVERRVFEVGPNPVSSAMTVRFTLVAPGHAAIDLMDIHGRRVARVLDRELESGLHEVRWDPPRALRRRAGVYFLRLSSPAGMLTRRIVITG